MPSSEPKPTAAQQLKPIKEAGIVFHLRPYQELVKVVIQPDEIVIVLKIYKYSETLREVRFTKSGNRLYCWKLKDKIWEPQEPLTSWDEDFVPYVERRYGVHISESEYRAKLEWEAMTYRCGTKRTPLDSFSRTVEERTSDTTADMYKYWTGHELDLGYRTEKK